jgi:antirestriction protein ArdC
MPSPGSAPLMWPTSSPVCSRRSSPAGAAHENFKDRALAELEAESTAFVVISTLGIDSSDYSFGYVANWAGGGEQATARVTASCQNIRRAAASILGHCEVGDQEVAA